MCPAPALGVEVIRLLGQPAIEVAQPAASWQNANKRRIRNPFVPEVVRTSNFTLVRADR
jgi:hypothetical protein